jgi:2-polyprenyl-3-methyl-5-hydroxy-6-metoxy-1,4-benzoquinol methylase
VPTTEPLVPVVCNLCEGSESVVLYESPVGLDDGEALADFMASTDRFDRYGRIVRCTACGLVFTNPRPSARRIAEGYSEAVDHDYALQDSSRSINAHLALHTIKRFATGGRLLDVGAATGYFLNAARLDFETCGIEPSRWAAEYARSRLGLDVRVGNLEDMEFEAESFDVVTLNDVIEHLTDPLAALKRLNALLKPGGLLYLVTPDVKSVSARVLRGHWWGLRPAHLYYFAPDTLTAMLGKAGFEVVLLKSYGRIFTYEYWLSRLKNYPSWLFAVVKAVIVGLRLENKFLYLDTRDSMELCVLKRR